MHPFLAVWMHFKSSLVENRRCRRYFCIYIFF